MQSTFDRAKELAKAELLPRLAWAQAVVAMRNGYAVRRIADMQFTTERAPTPTSNGEPVLITVSGPGAIMLRMAVNEHGEFHKVYCECSSARSPVFLFEPPLEAQEATDWVVLHDERMW